MPADAFCRLLGYQRDELIGKSYGELTNGAEHH
jgi:PAS domain-containing protein